MMNRPVLVAACFVAGAMIASASAQQQPQQQSQPPARDTSARPTTPAATAPASGRMTGRVVAADSGRPVKRARVFITTAELPGGRAVLTDDNGAFDFTDLPAGRYTINASKTGYIQLSYGQRRPLQAGTPLQLLVGQQLKGVDFSLPRGGVITGRVSDESGAVMPGVQVQVMRSQYQQGDRRMVPAGNGQTDDRGIYRVWGLNPGEYYVSATARSEGLGGRGGGGRAGNLQANVVNAPSGLLSDEQDQYSPTYFPGVGSPTEAKAVTVGVSQEVVDIDFALQLVRLARVAGHLENPDGSSTAQGTVSLTPQGGSGGNARGRVAGNAFGARVGGDGQFSIANVPPGLYTLYARNYDRDAPLSTSQPLSVSSGDIATITVVLQAGGSIAGSIVFLPGTTPVPGDLSRVPITTVTTGPEDNMGPMNSRVNRDGTFTLDGVSVGNHLIRAPSGSGPLRGWTLKSVTVDGRDVTDTPISVRSGQHTSNVVVTFSDKINEINGTVTDVSGTPVTEYTVLVFPTNSAAWRAQSRQIATTRPDQTGKFRIRNLPAGEYYVATVDPPEQGEWFEPAYLDQHRSGAARVTLGDGDVKTQDFRVQR